VTESLAAELVKFASAQLNDFLRQVNATGGVYGVLLPWREALTIKGWS
jgi:hypothetical protein